MGFIFVILMKAKITMPLLGFILFSCTNNNSPEESKPTAKSEISASTETSADSAEIIAQMIGDSITQQAKLKTAEEQVETVEYVVPKIVEVVEDDERELNFDPDQNESEKYKTKPALDDPFALYDPNKVKPKPMISGDENQPVSVAVQAQYPGGEVAFAKFIKDNFVFPKRCKEEGINGYVRLKFIVDKRGYVSNIVALDQTKSCSEFTTEAIRVMKLTNWVPGNTNGKFYPSYRTVPISLNAAEE